MQLLTRWALYVENSCFVLCTCVPVRALGITVLLLTIYLWLYKVNYNYSEKGFIVAKMTEYTYT